MLNRFSRRENLISLLLPYVSRRPHPFLSPSLFVPSPSVDPVHLAATKPPLPSSPSTFLSLPCGSLSSVSCVVVLEPKSKGEEGLLSAYPVMHKDTSATTVPVMVMELVQRLLLLMGLSTKV
ncbi:hypothetical protein RIF29_29015 [Crotalaria pallida]|uniref:Uncharacterized protein n=1 Tax=Crotalaria pallida TaxID=3830 RepID=A0AAN9EDR4_CROPI